MSLKKYLLSLNPEDIENASDEKLIDIYAQLLENGLNNEDITPPVEGDEDSFVNFSGELIALIERYQQPSVEASPVSSHESDSSESNEPVLSKGYWLYKSTDLTSLGIARAWFQEADENFASIDKDLYPESPEVLRQLKTWMKNHWDNEEDRKDSGLMITGNLKDGITYEKAARLDREQLALLSSMLYDDIDLHGLKANDPNFEDKFLRLIYDHEIQRDNVDNSCDMTPDLYPNQKPCKGNNYCDVDRKICLPLKLLKDKKLSDKAKVAFSSAAQMIEWHKALEAKQQSLIIRKEGNEEVVVPPCGMIDGEFVGCKAGKFCNIHTSKCEDNKVEMRQATVNGFNVFGSTEAMKVFLSKIIDRARSTGNNPDIISDLYKESPVPQPSDRKNADLEYKGIRLSDVNGSHYVPTLKEIARAVGVAVSGKKAELIERIRNKIIQNAPPPVSPPRPPPKKVAPPQLPPKKAPSPKVSPRPLPPLEGPRLPARRVAAQEYKGINLSDVKDSLLGKDLKDMAQKVGVGVSGNKADLAKRIRDKILSMSKASSPREVPPPQVPREVPPPQVRREVPPLNVPQLPNISEEEPEYKGIKLSDVKGLLVKELKGIAQKVGVSGSGNKADLIDRIQAKIRTSGVAKPQRPLPQRPPSPPQRLPSPQRPNLEEKGDLVLNGVELSSVTELKTTVASLKGMAKKINLTGYGKVKKSELIELIRNKISKDGRVVGAPPASRVSPPKPAPVLPPKPVSPPREEKGPSPPRFLRVSPKPAPVLPPRLPQVPEEKGPSPRVSPKPAPVLPPRPPKPADVKPVEGRGKQSIEAIQQRIRKCAGLIA